MSVIEKLTFITWSLEHVHVFFILGSLIVILKFGKNGDSEIEVVYTSGMDED